MMIHSLCPCSHAGWNTDRDHAGAKRGGATGENHPQSLHALHAICITVRITVRITARRVRTETACERVLRGERSRGQFPGGDSASGLNLS